MAADVAEDDKVAMQRGVAQFLLEEGYLLAAFELLHELTEGGQADGAVDLKDYFSDAERFPPDDLAMLANPKGMNMVALLDKANSAQQQVQQAQQEAAEWRQRVEQLATDFAAQAKQHSVRNDELERELKTAQQEAERERQRSRALQAQHQQQLQHQHQQEPQQQSHKQQLHEPQHVDNHASPGHRETDGRENQGGASPNGGSEGRRGSEGGEQLGALDGSERWEMNWAVRDYLVEAGYKLTAITFCEEEVEQKWEEEPHFLSHDGKLEDDPHQFLRRLYRRFRHSDGQNQSAATPAMVTELQQQLEAAQKQRDELQAAAASLQEEKRGARDALRLSEEKSRRLEDELRSLASTQQELECQVRSTSAAANEHKRRFEEETQLAASRKVQLAELEAELCRQKESADWARKAAEEAKAEARRAREELDSQRAAQAKAVAAVEGAAAAARKQAAETAGQVAELRRLLEQEKKAAAAAAAVATTAALAAAAASGGGEQTDDVRESEGKGEGAGVSDEQGASSPLKVNDGAMNGTSLDVAGASASAAAAAAAALDSALEQATATTLPAATPARAAPTAAAPAAAAAAAGGGGGGLESSVRAGETALVGIPTREEGGSDREALELIARCLPKVAPNVLINHREELLPLMLYAIERHPEEAARKSLVHGLFNLIKKPDEDQRTVIVSAIVRLAQRIGAARLEVEVIPQCWDETGHKNEEKRLMVLQLCRDLAPVAPTKDVRDGPLLGLILRVAEDPAAIVREAAAHNLARVLPCLDNMAVYARVEEAVFQLVCDSDGAVVEETLNSLVPAFVAWAKARRHPFGQVLRALLHRLRTEIEKCPSMGAVEGTAEARMRVVGERERWNIDVLLRMLTELLPEVRHVAVKTCPEAVKVKVEVDVTAAASGAADGAAANSNQQGTDGVVNAATRASSTKADEDTFFTDGLLKSYASSKLEWPAFDWLPVDCLPAIIQLALMLPPKEERLRVRICSLLLSISRLFGRFYLMAIVLPTFLTAVGHIIDTSTLPAKIAAKVDGLKPSDPCSERLAKMCVLPLLLAGVLGSPNMREGYLRKYLREWVLSTCTKSGSPWSRERTPELVDDMRFLCMFEEHRETVSSVLWDLVVNPAPHVRVTAALLFQTLAPYVDAKRVNQQILPALITLAADPVIEVKHSTIAAFGAVAQQFKDDTLIDKIRAQMDLFLEDGSHEASVAVINALTAAVPMSTTTLREYLLQKVHGMATHPQLTAANIARRREKAEALCSAIRALEHTDMSSTATTSLFLPSVQALLKDPEALEPGNREALEAILRDRWAGKIEAIGKAMGKTLFGGGGLLQASQSGARQGTAGGSGAAGAGMAGGFQSLAMAFGGAGIGLDGVGGGGGGGGGGGSWGLESFGGYSEDKGTRLGSTRGGGRGWQPR